jgi:hypothetical protein
MYGNQAEEASEDLEALIEALLRQDHEGRSPNRWQANSDSALLRRQEEMGEAQILSTGAAGRTVLIPLHRGGVHLHSARGVVESRATCASS